MHQYLIFIFTAVVLLQNWFYFYSIGHSVRLDLIVVGVGSSQLEQRNILRLLVRNGKKVIQTFGLSVQREIRIQLSPLQDKRRPVNVG